MDADIQFALVATAFAVMLSAIVRSTRSGAAWQAIAQGQATLDHVRDVSGVVSPADVQETFGPPTMDGVYPVTVEQVRRRRTLAGFLMGERWLDRFSQIAAALVLAPVFKPWWLDTAADISIMVAAALQVAGWAASARLIGR